MAFPKSAQFVKNDPRRWKYGKQAIAPEVRDIRKLTAESFALQFADLMKLDHEELYDIYKDPKTPILRSYLARCLLLGKLRGDYYTMNLMLDRIVGKVKEPVSPDQENTLKELLNAMIGAAKAAALNKEAKKK